MLLGNTSKWTLLESLCCRVKSCQCQDIVTPTSQQCYANNTMVGCQRHNIAPPLSQQCNANNTMVRRQCQDTVMPTSQWCNANDSMVKHQWYDGAMPTSRQCDANFTTSCFKTHGQIFGTDVAWMWSKPPTYLFVTLFTDILRIIIVECQQDDPLNNGTYLTGKLTYALFV